MPQDPLLDVHLPEFDRQGWGLREGVPSRVAYHGSAGHWLPAATWRQAMGNSTAPPVTQHLKPDAQSVSWPQGDPAPPFPVMHEVVGMMSTPFW